MSDLGFALFDTAIGCCGIVWSGRGIVGVQLPERSENATRNRVLRRFPVAQGAAPPAEVQRVIDGIVALLNGEPRALGDATLDLQGVSDFNRRVYEVARSIGAGATRTYGEVAERLGDRTLARDVAAALSQNPCPIIVPCHRVMAAGGKTGGFSAPGGVRTKLRMLSIEGAQPVEPEAPMLFDRLPLMTAPHRRP
ncbi:MAG TPA: methylated-DNA--[protein]-cysteine S-methyltransferase [Xanthobacteraceae bacterium]|jgi:methylated-DNA-[protein]-cysteine S-methyltransferase|nr:methylated-DNA--[protein]-cysteine S-methyltransferase [Xanthobacteraceae bacterium]